MKKTIITAVITALVMTASATAVTNSLISTEQIKNGTIRMADLHPSTKNALRGQQGPRGYSGNDGIGGATGPAGPAGGFDPNKVTTVLGTEAVIGQYQVGSSEATCPAGARVIAGGFIGSADPFISYASGTTTWRVSGSTTFSGGAKINAFAVCAAP